VGIEMECTKGVWQGSGIVGAGTVIGNGRVLRIVDRLLPALSAARSVGGWSAFTATEGEVVELPLTFAPPGARERRHTSCQINAEPAGAFAGRDASSP
jgi:hypothetical protein